MKNHHHVREKFGSQFGLIMSAVGSAVGLGNIWRFSYILGVNGEGHVSYAGGGRKNGAWRPFTKRRFFST
jgi:hypothetical protein